jgi:hypothetical protein
MFPGQYALRFLVVGVASMLGACVVYEHDSRHEVPTEGVAGPPSGGVSGGVATASPSSGSATPMLVEVDTDQTMNAAGGDGVGVFVEYGKGGHWHVWWTCDTLKTQQSCDFAVTLSVAAGQIGKLDASELAGGFVASPTPSRIDAKSTTTTEVDGVRFDSDPGAVLTLQASVGGVVDGAYIFFVQAGKLNGGFAGKLTNPLQLQGTIP